MKTLRKNGRMIAKAAQNRRQWNAVRLREIAPN